MSPFCLGMVRDPATVVAAYDAGINFFFVTADMHWPLYEGTRRGLAMLFARGGGVRDDVVVGVVSYATQPVFCYAPFNEVIDAVPGLERIDLSIIGGTYAHEFMVRLNEYRRHREGAVRGVKATGATFHDRVAAAEASRHAMVDIAFSRYNAVHRGAERDLFPFVDPTSTTLLYNFINTHGYLKPARYEELGLSKSHWRPKVTDYYRFVLARRELDGVLLSLSTPDHVRALKRALRKPLTEEELTYIRDLADLDKGEASLA